MEINELYYWVWNVWIVCALITRMFCCTTARMRRRLITFSDPLFSRHTVRQNRSPAHERPVQCRTQSVKPDFSPASFSVAAPWLYQTLAAAGVQAVKARQLYFISKLRTPAAAIRGDTNQGSAILKNWPEVSPAWLLCLALNRLKTYRHYPLIRAVRHPPSHLMCQPKLTNK